MGEEINITPGYQPSKFEMLADNFLTQLTMQAADDIKNLSAEDRTVLLTLFMLASKKQQ